MQRSGYQFMPLLPPPSQFESAAHNRLGGMIVAGVASTGRAVITG